MLEKYKSYKKEVKEKFEFYEKIKPLVYIIIFIMLLLLVFIFRDSTMPTDISKITADSDQIIPLFNDIKDNYTQKVTITKGMNTTKYTYRTDGEISFYDYDEITEYMIYKGKTYKVDNVEPYKARLTNKEIFTDPLADVNFIKKLLPHCEFVYENATNSICELDLYTFMNEYNNHTGEYFNGSDDKVRIKVTYYSSYIYGVSIDYSNVNKKINGSYEGLNYQIKYSDVNKNDFKDLFNIIMSD